MFFSHTSEIQIEFLFFYITNAFDLLKDCYMMEKNI